MRCREMSSRSSKQSDNLLDCERRCAERALLVLVLVHHSHQLCAPRLTPDPRTRRPGVFLSCCLLLEELRIFGTINFNTQNTEHLRNEEARGAWRRGACALSTLSTDGDTSCR